MGLPQTQGKGGLPSPGPLHAENPTLSSLGGGVGSTSLRTNVLFKGAKVQQAGGEREGQGRAVLKTMCFPLPVNHSALQLLTPGINGTHCFGGTEGPKCHGAQRTHC